MAVLAEYNKETANLQALVRRLAELDQAMAREADAVVETAEKLVATNARMWEIAVKILVDEGQEAASFYMLDILKRTSALTCQILDEVLQFTDQLVREKLTELAKSNATLQREIVSSIPNIDLKKIEQSWEQYRSGQLMDFETFKDELSRAAQ